MFFIGGINSSSKELTFGQSMICPHCEKLGHFKVIMTYMYFSFFFIPIFHWGKKYYVQGSCCKSLYSISKELGKSIEKGDPIVLQESDLFHCDTPTYSPSACPNCGCMLSPDFDFCPKCGKKL